MLSDSVELAQVGPALLKEDRGRAVLRKDHHVQGFQREEPRQDNNLEQLRADDGRQGPEGREGHDDDLAGQGGCTMRW